MADPQIEQELQNLKSDVAALRSDISDLARTMGEIGTRRAHAFRDQVADDIRNSREELRRRLDKARDRGRQAYHDVEEQVTEHPLGSLAAAVGIGFILAKLLNSGDRH